MKEKTAYKKNRASQIIIALDVGSRDEGMSLVRQLKETHIFKVGLQLFSAEGPSLLKELQNMGKKVFLDLKLHDIPNTVAGAVRTATRFGVAMMTLHASGGREMMARAVQSAREEAENMGMEPPLLLAVTVLTSLGTENLREIGVAGGTMDQVLNLAGLASLAGIRGIVCSPHEIETVRKEYGSDLTIVTPGIRPTQASAQDQKRIMTPTEAIEKGANYLVIGRPITEAPSPRDAFFRIIDELEASLDSADRPD